MKLRSKVQVTSGAFTGFEGFIVEQDNIGLEQIHRVQFCDSSSMWFDTDELEPIGENNMQGMPVRVQEIITLLDGLGEIEDYEAGKTAEARLKAELFELGYVVRHEYNEDNDEVKHIAIRKGHAR